MRLEIDLDDRDVEAMICAALREHEEAMIEAKENILLSPVCIHSHDPDEEFKLLTKDIKALKRVRKMFS